MLGWFSNAVASAEKCRSTLWGVPSHGVVLCVLESLGSAQCRVRGVSRLCRLLFRSLRRFACGGSECARRSRLPSCPPAIRHRQAQAPMCNKTMCLGSRPGPTHSTCWPSGGARLSRAEGSWDKVNFGLLLTALCLIVVRPTRMCVCVCVLEAFFYVALAHVLVPCPSSFHPSAAHTPSSRRRCAAWGAARTPARTSGRSRIGAVVEALCSGILGCGPRKVRTEGVLPPASLTIRGPSAKRLVAAQPHAGAQWPTRRRPPRWRAQLELASTAPPLPASSLSERLSARLPLLKSGSATSARRRRAGISAVLGAHGTMDRGSPTPYSVLGATACYRPSCGVVVRVVCVCVCALSCCGVVCLVPAEMRSHW